VSGDLPQDVDGDASISHPGQSGMAQAVTAELLVPEALDDLIPVGGVA
jgi:hypothetical protein